MDYFKIPIGLVPRATTLRACVTLSVVFTLLGRLVVLGSLVLGNSLVYTKLYTRLNSDQSQQDISQCESVTVMDPRGFSPSLYER